MRNLIIFLGLFFSGVSSSDWGYEDEGHWPEKCRTGKMQSPINLDHEIAVERSYPRFVFSNYNREYPARVKNNGHSVELRVDSPLPTVSGGGLDREYTLDHLHFHWQSEHTIDSYRFPLEVHLVHYASVYQNLQEALKYKDGLAVLAVFYDLSPDDDIQFKPLVTVMENVEKVAKSISTIDRVQLSSFLPRDVAGYYRYNGSLTTPDCTEVVTWTIFTNTISISKEQAKHFESFHADKGNVLRANYRSLQNLEGRTIYRKISPIPHGAAKSQFEKSIILIVVLTAIVKIF